jgi:hypothetical protein
VVPRRAPRALVVSAAIALGAWFAERAIDPSGRLETIGVLAVIVVVGGGLYVLAMQLFRDPRRMARESTAMLLP